MITKKIKFAASLFLASYISILSCYQVYKPPRDAENDLLSSKYKSKLNLNITISSENGLTEILPDADFILAFSEPVNQLSSWKVVIAGTEYITGLWNSGKTMLTINPITFLTRESTINVQASGFTSEYDDFPFPDTSKAFTFLYPTAILNPADGSDYISKDTDIIITFSEAMIQNNSWSVTINGTSYDKNSPAISWNDKELTINPLSDFIISDIIAVNFSGFNAAIDNYPITGSSTTTFQITTVYPIADTGQTTSYSTVFGEDSDYVNIPNARSFNAPTQHATFTSDYITKDNLTGLIWKSCAEGATSSPGAPCSGGSVTGFNNEDAKTACSALNTVNIGEGYSEIGRAHV